jgi:hypothetical protein
VSPMPTQNRTDVRNAGTPACTNKASTELVEHVSHHVFSRRELIVVFAIGSLFALALGIRNGELDLYFYLMHGLHMADPSVLRHDWYTTQTIPHHVPWNYLVAAFQRVGILEGALVIGSFLMTLSFTTATYVAMKAYMVEPLLAWTMMLLLYVSTFTRGIGDWYLLPTILEPFGIGGAALVIGVAFLVWERPLAAGIALGVCAFMHSHLAVLVTITLAITTVLQWHRLNRSYLVRLLLPYSLLAAPTLVEVVRFARAPGAKEAFKIFLTVDPAHFAPWLVTKDTIIIFAACVLMAFAGSTLRPVAHLPRYVVTMYLVAVSIVVASLLSSAFEWSQLIHRAMPWRLSSFVNLVGIAVGAAGLTSDNIFEWRGKHRNAVAAVSLFVALSLLFIAGTDRLKIATLVVLVIPFVTALGRVFPAGRLTGIAFDRLPHVFVIATLCAIGISEMRRSHLSFRPAAAARTELYQWIRQQTDRDALFAVPPDWKDFRLIAQRAIVADSAGAPFYPPDTIEWDHRLADLTGLDHTGSVEEVANGYRTMNTRRLHQLQERYGVTYFVTDSKMNAVPGMAIVYESGPFQVIHLGLDTALLR